MTKLLGIIALLLSCSLLAAETEQDFSNYTCTIDNTGELTQFKCLNRTKGDDSAWFLQEGDQAFIKEVEPIIADDIKAELKERGVSFLDPLSFTALSFFDVVDSLNRQSLGESNACFQKIAYTSKEFAALPDNHSTIKRLKKLADALKEAGICSASIKSDNTSHGIDDQNHDDLLEHFLCISNSESTFGRDNIGMGGRGPWGIHPMHNQPKGTSAFTGGKTVTLKKNQLCYPSKAIVRDSNGREIKESKRYENYEVQVANATCALKLYKQSGYAPWGKGHKWGSNRHCSRSDKNRFKFKKFLKEKACCSKSCIAKVKDLI